MLGLGHVLRLGLGHACVVSGDQAAAMDVDSIFDRHLENLARLCVRVRVSKISLGCADVRGCMRMCVDV